jgi:hypothetical protein
MKMAVYIMQILSTKPNVVMSWGVCKFRALQGDEGVMFHVQGFKFNGWVKCVYDLGADLFNIFYIDNKGETQKIQKGIYFDELVDTIDREVEKVENYNQRVKELYSWINR